MKIVSARIARIGWQDYASGREYRPAEEVFAPASLATFDGVPITIHHVAWITDANVEKFAVGYVRNPRRDGDHVRAELHVFGAVASRVGHDLVELSAGYEADKDGDTQRNIRANHLALLPRGDARCGSSCSVDAVGESRPDTLGSWRVTPYGPRWTSNVADSRLDAALARFAARQREFSTEGPPACAGFVRVSHARPIDHALPEVPGWGWGVQPG